MKRLLDLLQNDIKQEPVLFQGVIQAGLGLLMSFGLHLSSQQMGSILVFTAAVLAWLTRQQVTPNPKLNADNPTTSQAQTP